MKVTGYKIREAISRNKLRRETASSQFPDSLHAFPGEHKPSPIEIVEAVLGAEMRIARLQVLQDQYNTQVSVQLSSSTVTLAYVIKLAGGLERVEKLWRGVAVKKKDRFLYRADNPLLRDEKAVAAVATLEPEQARMRAEGLQIQIGQLKELLGLANGRELDFEDLDGSLFE